MPLCPSCASSNTQAVGSQLICNECGIVLEESQIVSDVTFGENSAGGAIVQGSYVGNDQTHVRSSNPRFRSSGAGESREQTIYRAREAIERMGRANKIGSHVRERALRWFRLALEGAPLNETEPGQSEPKNFVLGRKQEYTVASCLYVACRMEKTTHMLIDFSESMSINVFELGRHYLQLVRALNLHLPVLDPSIYIMRFAALLDFGEHTNKVAKDAARLCARFKKDWLVDGRRPAGICGACLLLAARMNNFRRSMNEIVQVVKMADVTIRQRLEEFKRTPSGNLTIADFKSVWLEEEHEPPAFYRPQLEAEKAKQKEAKARVKGGKAAGKRRKKEATEDDEGGNDADEEDEELDKDAVGGELPPELDALATEATAEEINRYAEDPDMQAMDKAAEERNLASAERAKRGDVWHDQERDLMDDWPTANHDEAGNEEADTTAVNGSTEPAQPTSFKTSASQAQRQEDAVLQGDPSAQAVASGSGSMPVKEGSQQPAGHDNLSDLDEDELDQFILGPEEVKIKERVWMEFNHDYLQHALQRQLKEEADEKAGIKRRPNRRRGQAKPRDSSTAPTGSALESTRQMMQQKKKFSKKINYDALQGLFTGMDGAVGASSSSSGNGKSRKHRDAVNRKKRGRAEETTSGEETTDAETRDARGRQLFGNPTDLDDDDVIEEEASVPNNHPSLRKQSKAERQLKAKRNRGGATTDEGEESGPDFGQQFTDGATTDGDAGDADDGGAPDELAHYRRNYNQDGLDMEEEGEEYL